MSKVDPNARYIQFIDYTMDRSTGDKLVEVSDEFFTRLKPYEHDLRRGDGPDALWREIADALGRKGSSESPVDDQVVEVAIC